MRSIFTLLLIAFTLAEGVAQNKKKTKTSAAVTVVETPKSAKIDYDSVFKAVKWRNIGPFRGGRSVAASGVVGNPLVYYMGTTRGGLWKTTDAVLPDPIVRMDTSKQAR